MRFYKQPGLWCVYRLDEERRNGPPAVVWIGACPLEDIGRFPDAMARSDVTRNLDWIVRDGNRVVVDLCGPIVTSEQEARAAVDNLATIYSAQAGVMWLTDGQSPSREQHSDERLQGVRELTTGRLFVSIAEAAKALDLNREMIGRNARGDPRYKTVRGYKFERVQ